MERKTGYCHECLIKDVDWVQCRDTEKGREILQRRLVPDFSNRKDGIAPIVERISFFVDSGASVRECPTRRCGLVPPLPEST
jgi:hypothetical protein